MTFDPPGHGIGIHWRAIAIILIPPILGLMAFMVTGQVHVFLLPLVWLLGLPLGAVFACKYSSYVAETHAQPWGYIAFLAAMGSSMVALLLPFLDVGEWFKGLGLTIAYALFS